jgi:hypothetical protein
MHKVSLFSQKWSDLVCSAVRCLLNKDLKWRSGIIIKDQKEAVNHLSNLLEDLKLKINSLKSSDILPNSIFLPKGDESDFNLQIDLNSTFRMNPISILIFHDGKFIIHSNFGNEEISSNLRVELEVKEEMFPILNWVRVQKDFFNIKDIPNIGQFKMEKINLLMKVLSFNGLVEKV